MSTLLSKLDDILEDIEDVASNRGAQALSVESARRMIDKSRKEAEALIIEAQLHTLDAVIDLFDNPPQEVGHPEDKHYHTHQIVKMLNIAHEAVGRGEIATQELEGTDA